MGWTQPVVWKKAQLRVVRQNRQGCEGRLREKIVGFSDHVSRGDLSRVEERKGKESASWDSSLRSEAKVSKQLKKPQIKFENAGEKEREERERVKVHCE